ncbi:uncharacterized protein [Diadema antillarum]|uniref:uncharacterized protein n=1 Tax=Diadema antillarum TaxID=105358 RepID=UPI003A8B43C0
MAAPLGSITLRLPSAKFIRKRRKVTKDRTNTSENAADEVESTSETHVFRKNCSSEITCLPIIVEFRRLLESAKYNCVEVVPGVSNRELLHAVVGLYDTCLPDITPQVLYATVTGKWAKTLILVRSTKDVAKELRERIQRNDKDVTKPSSEGEAIPSEDADRVKKASSDKVSQEADHHSPVTREGKEEEDTAECEARKASLLKLLEENAEEEEDVLPNRTDVGDGGGGGGGDGNKKDDAEDDEDILEEDEQRRVFAEVFSDTDTESEEESDDDEDPDFSKGINEFLRLVKRRRELRDEAGPNPSAESLEPAVGIESRIVACATWEKSNIRPGEKIIQIDLVGVRKRCRRCGIGRYLLQQMKDVSIVGHFDTLVVYADHSAVDFFSLHGFSDDIVLNSKYSELADNWTNCTLMSYIPPFVGQTILRDTDMTLDLKAIELELQKWTVKSREAYQGQMSCLIKLRHEVIALRALVSSQKDLIESLTDELETVQRDKLMLEKCHLEYKIAAIKASYYKRHSDDAATNAPGADGSAYEPGELPENVLVSEDDDDEHEDEKDEDADDEEEDDDEAGAGVVVDDDDDDDDDDDEIDTATLIKALEMEANALQGTKQNIDHGSMLEGQQIAIRFEEEMIDKPLPGQRCRVTDVTMATGVSMTIKELYGIRLKQLGDPTIRMRLYFCGTGARPERLGRIMSNGFSEEDFSYGDYGVGLYFSEYPSVAAQFSAFGKMLVAEVGLGNTESVVKKDRTRVAPPIGFDSIVTPGRLSRKNADGGDGAHESIVPMDCKEYIIFDSLQVLPVCLVEYTTLQSRSGVRL